MTQAYSRQRGGNTALLLLVLVIMVSSLRKQGIDVLLPLVVSEQLEGLLFSSCAQCIVMDVASTIVGDEPLI